MSDKRCFYCGEGPEKDEMRPYGPNMSWIHFRCMVTSPAREAEAVKQFTAQLDAAGPVSMIDGDETGVRPFKGLT